MHKRVVPALAAFALLTAACADSSSSANAALETQDQIASYGVGLNMGQNLQAAQGSLDMAAFMRGVEEAMAGVEPAERVEVGGSVDGAQQQDPEEQQRRGTEKAEFRSA